MRKMKSLLIAAVMFLGVSSTSAIAQTKVAHINLSELIPLMPELKAANEELKKMGESFEKDYQAMANEYRTKAEKYSSEAKTAGDVLNETRGKELQDIEERIMNFRQTAQTQLSEKEVALQTPILEKARLAIQKVAKAKGYDLVLDSTPGAGVLMATNGDLLQDVKTELNIK